MAATVRLLPGIVRISLGACRTHCLQRCADLHVVPLLLASHRDELREVRDETTEVGFADQAEAFGFAFPVVQAAQESGAYCNSLLPGVAAAMASSSSARCLTWIAYL